MFLSCKGTERSQQSATCKRALPELVSDFQDGETQISIFISHMVYGTLLQQLRLGLQGWFLLRAFSWLLGASCVPWFTDSHHFPVSQHCLLLFVSVYFCKDIGHVRLEPTKRPHLTWIICKDPISKKGHIHRYWGLEHQYLLAGDHFSHNNGW